VTSNKYIFKQLRGMSYIEILIAQLLIAVALVGLIKLHTQISLANREALKVTAAMSLAQNQITELKSHPFRSVVPGTQLESYQAIHYQLDWTTEIAYFESKYLNTKNWQVDSPHDIENIEIGKWIHLSVRWLNEKDTYEFINVSSFLRKN